jgi:demethylmenaquinone methyltransferase/2-methoxy-6-polyprenyl-1,4-benzoquinol methylase
MNLSGQERAQYVQEMFAKISNRYDLMNRLMTLGQDVNWRKEVIDRAALPHLGRMLDLGAGTGDLAFEALDQKPGLQVTAADFTVEMMETGKKRITSVSVDWSAADALNLPFSSDTFDAVVSGFLMRNVTDVTRCLSEQRRVLQPGGRIVILDTSPPPKTPIAPLIRIHLHTVIPNLGRLITGEADAYKYLPDSTESFLEPERLAARMLHVGFREVGFVRRMFGAVAIHWGKK